ncbi:unnamed protein product [Bursaphelenchus xylophilus]|nr:unnamed protein product [Bursaphelenchus xylophilus]CAG9109766.1 unnamed protein product [Bursaphelenchus xylophilus]
MEISESRPSPPRSPVKELEEPVVPPPSPFLTSIALEGTEKATVFQSTPSCQKKEKSQIFLECRFSREDKAHKDAVLIPLSEEFVTCGKVFKDIAQLFGEPEDNLVLPCPWSVEEIQFTEQVLQFIIHIARFCHLDSIYAGSYYDWFRLIHCFRGRFRIKPFTCPSVMAMLIKNRKVFEFYILDCNMAFVDVLYSLQYLEKSVHPCLRLDYPWDFVDVKWICEAYRSVQPPKPDPDQKKFVEVRPGLNPNYDREI